MPNKFGKFIIEPGRFYISGLWCDLLYYAIVLTMAHGAASFLYDGSMVSNIIRLSITGAVSLAYIINKLFFSKGDDCLLIKW